MRGIFLAPALLLSACSAAAPDLSMRMAAFDAAKVSISVKEGQVRVDAETGLAGVDFAGTTAHVRLSAGQRLTAGFDTRATTFHIEVLEDADGPIDVAVGQTTVHATRGDVFDARVIGEHLEVAARRGLIIVKGPDGRSQEIAQGSQVTVAGGAKGAIHGLLPPAPPSPVGPRGPLREPRRPPILDRTDIQPAP